MARLTAAQRKRLSSSAFAGPNRSYPIHDPSHARNALSRVSQFGSSTEKSRVRSAVHKKFPSIGATAHGKRKKGRHHSSRADKLAQIVREAR